MAGKTLEPSFQGTLKDLCYADRKITTAFRKMDRAAGHPNPRATSESQKERMLARPDTGPPTERTTP